MLKAVQPFGDHLTAKRPSQADHRFGQCQVVAVMENVADKGLVDLDGLRAQVLEVVE
ncbi:hypothetical protein D3C84_1269840 [compost metagenome]